jgi:PhnB protein
MSEKPDIDQLDRAITDMLAKPGSIPPSMESSLAELLIVAHDLSSMPGPDFKARLLSELERKVSMSTKTVQFREGFRTVTPWICTPEAEAVIGFVQEVFGAVETGRASHGSGAIHAEVRIGDSMLMIDGGPAYRGPQVHAMLRVLVANSDEVYKRALDKGAVSTYSMSDNYGERFGCIRDRFGNQWIISTQTGPSYSEGLEHNLTTFVQVHGAAKFIDFLKQGLGARELMRADGPEGQVRHAIIGIGDSVIATSDAKQEETAPASMYLYVPDVDDLYHRAVSAGAQSTLQPTDHAYGDRGAAVTDEWGNSWYIATPL